MCAIASKSQPGVIDNGLPKYSLDFENSGNSQLRMPVADFGTVDRAKAGFSVWYKRESTGVMSVACLGNGGSPHQGSWNIYFDNSNRIACWALRDQSTTGGELITSAAFTDTSSFHHLYVTWDVAAASSDRMRMWHDGAEITSFFRDTVPSVAFKALSGQCGVGDTGATGTRFDGLLYQAAFFSGTLPTITDLYDAGHPKDVSDLSGLISLLDCAGGIVTSDKVLSANWTPGTGTPTASLTIPT
jgi:hypothetical protein